MKQIVAIGIGILFLISCKKEIPGCMDLNAENYDFEAEVDAGSCSYRGSAIFYHDSQTSQNLINAGVTNVKLYVEGVFFEAMSPFIGFTFVPTCEHPDAMKFQNYGIGNLPSKSFNYEIKDQNESILASGTFLISGNECNAVEYNY
jgi:hypothetical protein